MPMFNLGDVITISGVYEDGTQEDNRTSPELYQNKPLQHFKVDKLLGDPEGIRGTQLAPIHADGTPDPDYNRRHGRAPRLPRLIHPLTH